MNRINLFEKLVLLENPEERISLFIKEIYIVLESKLEKKKNKSFFKKVPKLDKDVKECIANIKEEINAIQKKIPKTKGRENDGLKIGQKRSSCKIEKIGRIKRFLDLAIDKNSKRFYKNKWTFANNETIDGKQDSFRKTY